MKKNKKDLKVIPDPLFFRVVQGKRILLDTSVFGDAFEYPVEWGSFFNLCTAAGAMCVTISPVCMEFAKGSTEKEILQKREKFVEEIIRDILPMTSDVIEDHLFELIEKYIPHSATVSITDFLLAKTLQKHATDLLLLTKNPTDFPSSVFQLKSHLLIAADRMLHCYGLYGYNEAI